MQNFSEETYGRLLNSVLVTSISILPFYHLSYSSVKEGKGPVELKLFLSVGSKI